MLKNIILFILFTAAVIFPISGTWACITGTKHISNDAELVEFINRHGGEGESYTRLEIETNINQQALSEHLELTPKGRFAVLTDGLLNGFIAGIFFAIVAYFWRDRQPKEAS